MFRQFATVSLLAGFLVACSSVPITGRRQLNLVPTSQMTSLSQTQYRDFLSQSRVITSGPEADMVRRVGNRIKNSVEDYMRQNGMADELKNYSWEFNLVDDPSVNAWCMPGGRVVFYTGILPYTKNEDGLATVMGHEIAHAVANHGNERVSQGLVQQMGGVALAVALSDRPQQTQQLFQAAYGVGSQVGVMLPFSRQHETEADRLGLIFMAMAGYNPDESVPFWQRMSQAGGGGQPEFLSTHPAPSTRINNLRNKFIPEAKAYAQRKN